MQITACLIVRNESALLEQALKSLQGVDEIVIVDTGSLDNTVEIAKRYTDKVFEFFECNEPPEKHGLFMDFSGPRNFAALKSSNDWILILDADEVLEEGSVNKIKSFVDNLLNKVAFEVEVIQPNHEAGPQIRCYDRRFCKYYDEAHNWLGVKTDYGVLPVTHVPDFTIKTDIKILSYYSPNHNIDPDRTLRILQRMIEKNPHYPRALFYISREYLRRDQPMTAFYYLKKYIIFAQKTNELAEALYTLGCIEVDAGDLEQGREYFFQSLAILPTLKANYERLADLHRGSMLSNIFEKFAEAVDNQGAMFVKLKS